VFFFFFFLLLLLLLPLSVSYLPCCITAVLSVASSAATPMLLPGYICFCSYTIAE
jgi:hypothetical protein